MSDLLKGIGVGGGIFIAKAFVLNEVNFNFETNSHLSIDEEKKNLKLSIEKAEKELHELVLISAKNISEEKSEIFKAHIEMLKDVAINDEIIDLIGKKYSAAYSVDNTYKKYIEMFSNMEDKYFRERASDLFDIKKRLLAIICNVKLPDLLLIQEECIVVANDLTPSETVLLNKNYVKGFVTDVGGATSHSAIMAKTLGIIAVVSTKISTKKIKHGDLIAIDAIEGIVDYQINDQSILVWKEKKMKYEKFLKEIEEYRDKPCITQDGVTVKLLGNIGQPKDVKKVIENRGVGIGLFRSEFLYMDNTQWPTEEEQFNAYKEVLQSFKSDEYVTIRTLDIGGDKHLNYYTFPKELNPFLGYRAVRLTLKEKDVFRTQLRALLRSSVYGNLKIMFPMIAIYDEFIEAKELINKYSEELKKEGHKISSKISVGMMVEIPSSALMADQFAEVADFFSIGSNDLIQYTHAVDRLSESVNYLYQPNSPGIIKLIKMSADAANNKKIEISVCGEMAGCVKSIPILIGLGITTLSMSSSSIPTIKRIINNIKMSDCQKLALNAIECKNEIEVNKLVDNFLKQKNLI